nr:GNAT family N-acetyltransferase [uncultured Carboxylicivirga sp.]
MDIKTNEKRIILSPLTQGDISSLFKIYSNKANMKFIPNNHINTADELKKKYSTLRSDSGYGIFAIKMIASGEIIGEAGIFDSFNDNNIAELGFIIDEIYWSKGYGTEVCNYLINHCFEQYNFTRIVARMYAENTGSIKVCKKCGMQLKLTFSDAKGNQGIEYRIHKSSI